MVDNTAPTVTITGVPLTLSSAPFTATVTFSEDVTGFVLGDIRLVNATSSNFTVTNAPVYTALITPATDGAVTVNVAAGVAEDLAGNANTVADQAHVHLYRAGHHRADRGLDHAPEPDEFPDP